MFKVTTQDDLKKQAETYLKLNSISLDGFGCWPQKLKTKPYDERAFNKCDPRLRKSIALDIQKADR